MRSDRRVQYTKKVLKESLLAIMADRPVSRITVKELCEHAGVNRSTFYVHYSDPFELLAQIENGLMEDIRSSLRSQRTARGGLTGLLTDIFSAIKANSALCRVILGKYGDKDFLERILNIAKEQSISEWKNRMPGANNGELELLYLFYSEGSAAIIRQWVNGGMEMSPEELARFVERISVGGLSALK